MAQDTFLLVKISSPKEIDLREEHINIINESIQNYNYEVVSPESNYTNVFEGTIKKLKGTNNESTN